MATRVIFVGVAALAITPLLERRIPYDIKVVAISHTIEGSTVTVKYSAAQLTALARHQDSQFDEFLRHLFADADDFEFFRYVHALMRKIYILHQEDKMMTKSQACRMIPARNAATCIKYVDEAERRAFITYITDANDKRKILIRPSTALIKYIEDNLSNNIDDMRVSIAEIGARGFPHDNIPFSGNTIPELYENSKEPLSDQRSPRIQKPSLTAA